MAVISASLNLCLTLPLCNRRETLRNGFLISAKAVAATHNQAATYSYIYMDAVQVFNRLQINLPHYHERQSHWSAQRARELTGGFICPQNAC